MYTDDSFSMSDALMWSDLEVSQMTEYTPEWKRLSKMYPSLEGYSLWGSTGIRPDDVGQGAIGDCWFISAATAVAEDY